MARAALCVCCLFFSLLGCQSAPKEAVSLGIDDQPAGTVGGESAELTAGPLAENAAPAAPRDRSSVTALSAGFAAVAPSVPDNGVLPFGDLYLWRRPDRDTFFRGVVAGVANEIFFSKSARRMQPFEGVFTFENYTVPVDQTFFVDGMPIDDEELRWGQVYPGLGVGFRRPLASGRNDNMLAVTFLAEPGVLYFNEGNDTDAGFSVPENTFEVRARLQMRLDALQRNALELPDQGYATGFDTVYGYRANWDPWGPSAQNDANIDYLAFEGYLFGASRVPFVESNRHRLLGSLHGGLGANQDRFSAFHVGGGPRPYGDEYGGIRRPIIPGALINEFEAPSYAVLLGEYRWELIPSTFLSLRSSFSYVDRLRSKNGQVVESNDFLASAGFRITTLFLLETKLQLDYNFSAGVIRRGDFGGHEVLLQLFREF